MLSLQAQEKYNLLDKLFLRQEAVTDEPLDNLIRFIV